VWEEVRLPDGKSLMPGVVGHATDIIEHPELVAQRLIRFARLVGRENVIAGTDCGLGGRVGHPEIVWAKLADLAAGARLATAQLWP
jgi:5-methyltetrahydropteroyltriglutamate--homocysteine methyltransferase